MCVSPFQVTYMLFDHEVRTIRGAGFVVMNLVCACNTYPRI